jgi:iron complex transport system ATP-binding protein
MPVTGPLVVMQAVSYAYPEGSELVFSDLSCELPAGPVALVGQNGTGKSTLMLLASGIAVPSDGAVFLDGVDTAELQDPALRQRHVSLIHQNMEFESEADIGSLLHFVVDNGFHEQRAEPAFRGRLIDELVAVLELEPVLAKRTTQVSKGELQRTLIAFCVLYGSRTLMMDEPVFALEEQQKHKVMAYLLDYTTRNELSWYFSVHELQLSAAYSRNCVLFDKSLAPAVGSTEDMHQRGRLEVAYQVPYEFLKRREALYRAALIQT